MEKIKMAYEQIAFASIVLAGFIAAYTDLKTGYIYDWITYPLIGIGIILSILTQQWIGVLLAMAIYGAGILAYNSGKMGGGDIKLLAGMALVQPVYQGMIFVLGVLLVAALAACVALGAYYVSGYWLTKPKVNWNTPRKRMSALFGLAVIGFVGYALQRELLNAEMSLLLGVSLFIGVVFYAFEEEIKAHAFLKRIPLSELEDDEVLATEQLSEEEKKRFGKNIPGLVGTEDTLRLTHMGFRTIPVYRNLPKFAPFLLVGMLVVYLFPGALTGIVPAFL